MPVLLSSLGRRLRSSDQSSACGNATEFVVGSHRQYVHPDNPNVVTVPGPPGKQVATGTLSSIRRASGISELR